MKDIAHTLYHTLYLPNHERPSSHFVTQFILPYDLKQKEPNFKLQLKLKTKNKQINKEREIIQNVKQSDWPASVFQWSQSCDLEST